MVHAPSESSIFGMSAAFPRGAPASTHAPISAISSGVSAPILWVHDPQITAGQTMRGSVALLGNYVYHNTGGATPNLVSANKTGI